MYDDQDARERRENREKMREVRACRTGGRKKKLKKPGSRKLSEKGLEREEAASKEAVVLLNISPQKVELERSRKYLSPAFKDRKVEDATPAYFWRSLKGFDQKFKVRTAKNHYALSLRPVLAALESIACAGHDATNHIRVMAEFAGSTITKRLDPIALALFHIIDYTEDEGSQQIDKHDLSRDAAAIRYLLSQGVRSYTLEKWIKDNPGGVDKWSRLASKNSSPTKKGAEERKLSARDRAVLSPDYYDDFKPPKSTKAAELGAASKMSDEDSNVTPTSEQFDLEANDSVFVIKRKRHPEKMATTEAALKFSFRGASGSHSAFNKKLLKALSKLIRKEGFKTKLYQ